MRIAIFGTGGVGGYFGGRLAQAGEKVIFIARGEHLQALQSQGLRVDSTAGDFVVQPVQATHDPAQVGPVDVVLIGVKAWQVGEAAEAMRPMVGPETFIVPLQNGVDAPTQLAELLGSESVLGGLCGLMSYVAGPGHIHHIGISPFIKFGELDNRMSQRVKRLRQTFDRTQGVTVEVPADIQIAMWQKFLFITAFSGIGAVTRVPVGIFRSVPKTRQMLRQVMQEIFEVGQAHDIGLSAAIVDQTLAAMDKLPPAGTASMQRDIMEGRPSELEAQNGAVVRLGQAVGVDTPVNAFIYHSLLPLELQLRSEMGLG